ncbi:hypothetical protein D3C79_737250 [compost metagenome]
MGQRQVKAGKGGSNRTAGLNFALFQQHQVVRQPGHLVLGMADINQRDLQLIVQALQVRQDLTFARPVEGGQGFVHQQQLRATEQGPGDPHALRFATRQRGGLAFEQVLDAQQRAGLVEADLARLGGDAAPAEGQVAVHAQVWKQARFLKHIADRAQVRGDEMVAARVLPDLSIDFDIGLGRSLQAGEAAQAGGLA